MWVSRKRLSRMLEEARQEERRRAGVSVIRAAEWPTMVRVATAGYVGVEPDRIPEKSMMLPAMARAIDALGRAMMVQAGFESEQVEGAIQQGASTPVLVFEGLPQLWEEK